MSGPAPPWPTTARTASGDAADRRCSVIAAFSRPTRLPNSASLMSGCRTPSDMSSPSQVPDSATTGHGRRCREQLHHGGDVGAAEHGEHTLLVAALRLKEPIHGPVLGLGVPDLQPREQLPDVPLRGDGPEASDSMPVLTSSAQSQRLRSSFPKSASMALCVRSFPPGGGPRQHPARSAASASVAATDCRSSPHSAAPPSAARGPAPPSPCSPTPRSAPRGDPHAPSPYRPPAATLPLAALLLPTCLPPPPGRE